MKEPIDNDKKEKSDYSAVLAEKIRIIAIIATLIGLLFRVMHWPFSGILLVSGIALFVLYFLLQWPKN